MQNADRPDATIILTASKQIGAHLAQMEQSTAGKSKHLANDLIMFLRKIGEAYQL